MPTQKKKPEHRLEDLDVREVSIVDRPANQRRFLVVKRDGSAEVKTEDEMAGRAMPSHEREQRGYQRVEVQKEEDDADNAQVFEIVPDDMEPEGEAWDVFSDLFDVADDADDAEAEHDDEPPVEPVEKAAKAGEVLKAVAGWIAKLTAIANQLKRKGDGETEKQALTPPQVKGLTDLAKAIAAWVSGVQGDKGKGEPEEQTKDASQGVSAALQSLMRLSEKLKSLDAGDTVPPALVAQAAGAARVIAMVVQKYGSAQGDKKTEQEEQRKQRRVVKAFIDPNDESGDPEVVVMVPIAKGGAKLAKARLSKLREAVKMLVGILKEVDPEGEEDAADEGEPKKGKGKRRMQATKKSESSQPTFKIDLGNIGELVAEAVAKAVKPVTDKVDEIKKQVDDLDTRPGGHGSDDPPDVGRQQVQKKGGVFDSLFGSRYHS